MKIESKDHLEIRGKKVYMRKTLRGWSIVIMPDDIRADNFHGFPHIHMDMSGKHEPIKNDDFNAVFTIIIKHIDKNNGINKNELRKELLK